MYRDYKKRRRDKEVYRYTLILDEISIICAFFSAIAIRFNAIMNWVDRRSGIYVSMIITVFLFAIIVFYFYDLKNPNVVKMDPVDNFLRVCKNRFFLSLLTLMYFYLTQRSVLASRIVMALFLVLSAIYGFLLRMIFRKLYLLKWGAYDNNKTYQIILPVDSIKNEIDNIKNGGYETVLVRSGTAGEIEVRDALRQLEKNEIRSYLALNSMGYDVRYGFASDVKSYLAIPTHIRSNRFNLFGINYSIGKPEEAVRHVINHLEELKGKYICFSNVHTTVMAKEHRDYAHILGEAALVFPDGAPIAELQRKDGNLDADRVAGPDFMEHMFFDTKDGRISHYFYGSTQQTLDALREKLLKKYPGICIKGMYSPPFRASTPEEDEEDIKRINDSGADIVWIGLGAPKQEKWMNAHMGKINAVMMGVGAGFDFHAGTIQRAPVWIQRIGLEWMYRLFKDPKRLVGRYIVTNLKFMYYILTRK